MSDSWLFDALASMIGEEPRLSLRWDGAERAVKLEVSQKSPDKKLLTVVQKVDEREIQDARIDVLRFQIEHMVKMSNREMDRRRLVENDKVTVRRIQG